LTIAACSKRPSVLVALDISAAFDTIDHDILCQRAASDFGIHGVALAWLRSFVSGRSNYVCIGSNHSSTTLSSSGVPQGSVLGPILFAMFTAPVARIINQHGLQYHMYADDTQLYTALEPSRVDLTPIQQCTNDIHRWYAENGMMLNPTKSEIIAVGTRAQVEVASASRAVDVAGTRVPFSDHVKLLGVNIDSTLSFDRHVSSVVRSCNYHIRALRHIRSVITSEVATTVACSLVSSRLDYCNSLLHSTTAKNLKRLQTVQNDLARTVQNVGRRTSANNSLKTLHWLPIRERIDYKIATIVYKLRQTKTPAYLSETIVDYQPPRTLRSADKMLLRELEGPVRKLAFSSKAFSIFGPAVWNSLTVNCRSCSSLETFKRTLKTELFNRACVVPP